MSTTARTKRPTIRDVAAKAGVSKSLVSLVFSAPQTVSSYRKELVLKAADELGFSPSFLARSLELKPEPLSEFWSPIYITHSLPKLLIRCV